MDFGIPIAGNDSCVDTVRALHQTIVALRTALEKSRSEISDLKSQNWTDHATEDTIRSLSIENHVLRQKVINTSPQSQGDKRKDNRNKTRIESKNQKKCKSLENISDLPVSRCKSDQLSKSKTICFSNVFEGEKQISTTNSLHIKANREDRDRSRRRKSKSKDKSRPNVIFSEEPLDDNLSLSRRGSILDFETELRREDLNLNKRKCRKEKKTDKSIKKREETFVKESPGTRRKSSILGEEIEKVLIEQFPSSDKHTRKCDDAIRNVEGGDTRDIIEKASQERLTAVRKGVSRVKSKDTAKREVLRTQENHQTRAALIEKSDKHDSEALRTGDNQKPEGLQVKEIAVPQIRGEIEVETPLIKEGDLKKIEVVRTTRSEIGSPVETNGSETGGTVETTESEPRGPVETNGSEAEEAVGIIKSETRKDLEISETEQETAVGTDKSDQKCPVEEETDINKNGERDTTAVNSPIEKNQLDSSENGTEDALKSSETSTNSSSQKNVEISVKIYKGSKKPIEIDIQTKRKHRRRAKKMNNKSQNTSFDKDCVEAPSNEIRRHIDTATANNINDVEQEVDDIELIFTTDDTKETDFKEELVPIETYTETQLLQCPLSDYEEKLSAEASDRELEDDVFNDNFENENQENCNFQCQTYDFRRENSQIYNSKSDNSINHEDKSFKSYYSYQDSSFENKSLEKDESFDRFEEKTRIVETDISKIGIQDVEYNMGRRNTCPNPIQYRPIMHREALGRGLGSRKCRPILAHSNVIRKESGAQTDISALPGSSWRSESSLGHKVKVGENFTTLPSKFPHPGSRLRLSEKTVEARRVLLSDIGFTSMVPELSRSADHLCPPMMRGPVVSSYGQFLRTTDLYSPAYTSQKFVWTTTTPNEGSHSQSRYSSQYPLASPPVPTRRCSAPVSPSKKAAVMKTTPSKVRFANGSLPELRGDWTAGVDSGESTDSLVEEAEHFLRRSIDCLAPCKDVCFRSESMKMSGLRRASAPEPTRDNVPPPGWQPFLPRIPRDLHLDYWVKVISPEGRVRGGRVRYVGPLVNQTEAFVGVQLSTPDGHSDGTYNSRRYFNCEPYHGLFVPFKKIIMGWRP